MAFDDGALAAIAGRTTDESGIAHRVSSPWRAGAEPSGSGIGPHPAWHARQVPKVAATVNLDDEVLDAVRREAARSGRSEDQVVEDAVRRYLGPSVLDRLREQNRLDEDEAMAFALDEVAAHRRERRTGLSPRVEVVIDVNVLGHPQWSGPSAQLIEALRGSRLAALSSRKLLTELGDVLRRDRFRRYLSLDEVEEYVAEIKGLCWQRTIPTRFPRSSPDPDRASAPAEASGREPRPGSPSVLRRGAVGSGPRRDHRRPGSHPGSA
ncbi:MAG: ribbon-helix-helix protein, CopG family [Actinomycetota bacterium]|nr:ribbon-helix-helix protein, CopG family [Actinomycetota bacterium]